MGYYTHSIAAVQSCTHLWDFTLKLKSKKARRWAWDWSAGSILSGSITEVHISEGGACDVHIQGMGRTLQKDKHIVLWDRFLGNWVYKYWCNIHVLILIANWCICNIYPSSSCWIACWTSIVRSVWVRTALRVWLTTSFSREAVNEPSEGINKTIRSMTKILYCTKDTKP